MPFSKQEMYERVFRYYNLPGTEFGWDTEAASCVYLTEDKTKRCAVGVLLPEKEALDELLIQTAGGVRDLADQLDAAARRGGPGSRMAQRILRDLGITVEGRDEYGRFARFTDDSIENIRFLEHVQRIHDTAAEDFSARQQMYDYDAGEYVPNEDATTLLEAKRDMLRALNTFAADEGLATLEITL